MQEDKSKNSFLTSELDFEGFDDMLASPRVSSQPEPLSELPKEFVRKPEALNFQAAKTAAPVRKVVTPPPIVEIPRVLAKKKIHVEVKQDRFTLYAVAVALVALIAISAGIYLTQLSEKNSAGLSYIVLPQNLVIIDGLVARVQATIQVDEADRDWLHANKKALSESFEKGFSTLDLDKLRSPQGITEAQIELKKTLNIDLKTDKVDAVLLTELLIQEQT